MLRILFVCLSLMAICCSASAQDDRSKSDAYLEAQSIVMRARQQQRREMLREALKVHAVQAPIAVRQMTPQEKAELRQQLRQQRQDLIKKENQ
jgi:hypothetical protein